MTHQLVITAVMFLTCLSGLAQSDLRENLVPNPGFEQYRQCPDNISHNVEPGDTLIPHWYSPSNGSVDYYNACSNSYKSDTGDNWVSVLRPHSGAGCIGMLLNDEVREFIQVKLLEPLKKGYRYKLSFYVAHASKTRYATNAIDFYFSSEPVWIDQYQNISVKPSGVEEIIQSSDNWQHVTAFYTASGGEQYLTLGNTADWHKRVKLPGSYEYNYCYYFIDDVELTEDSNVNDDVLQKNSGLYQRGFENLVLNGGFEYSDLEGFPYTRKCNQTDIRIGPFWYSSGYGTSDFIYNAFRSRWSGHLFVDKNAMVDQALLEEGPFLGKGMAGIIPFIARNDTMSAYHEYLIGELTDTLRAGQKYFVSFKTRSAGFATYSINRLGLKFFGSYPKRLDHERLEMENDIGMNREAEMGITEGWTEISGWYTARGNEKFIAIGAIDEKPLTYFDNSLESLPFNRLAMITHFPTYYFIDEVIVSNSVVPSRLDTTAKHIVVLIDASQSMSQDGYLSVIKNAVLELCSYLSVRDEISLVTFGTRSEIHQKHLSVKTFSRLENDLSTLSLRGKSAYVKGLNLSLDVVKEPNKNVSNYVLLISDGAFSQSGTEKYYAEMQRRNCRFYPVLLGDTSSDTDALSNAADGLGGRLIRVNSDQLLPAILDIFSME